MTAPQRLPPDRAGMRRPRVVVVGGGLAGIAAAVTAADRGADVELLEGRQRLGGATFSFRRATGQGELTVDNGQHVFLRCCTAYLALLRRLGADGQVELQPRLSIPVLRPGRPPAVLRRGRLPAPLHLASVLRYAPLTPAERLRAVPAALALGRLDPRDPAADRTTFGDWLRRHGQTDGAIAALWDLVTTATLNLHANDASLALATKVVQTGLLDGRANADIGWARVPLGVVHGEAAARVLAAAGAAVRLGVRVREVRADAGGVTGVATDAGVLPADHVVVAVGHDSAAGLLPAGAGIDPAAVRRLAASPIVNLHVIYDRPVLPTPFAAGLGTPVQWLFDRTAAAGLPGRGRYLAVSLSAADEWIDIPTRALQEVFVPALRGLLPAAREAAVQEFFVTRERTATFRPTPGTAALRPAAQTALPGLWLAGAWTDTGWPATMEGAVRSGVAAAEQALAGSPGRRALAAAR